MLHTIISKGIFIDHAALAFVRHVGHPDAANAHPILLRSSVDFLPKWFIQFLRETISILLILCFEGRRNARSCESGSGGSGPRHFVSHTLGKPFAWAARIVISPGCGLGLSNGIYCFTARCKGSSWSLAVAPGYSLMC